MKDIVVYDLEIKKAIRSRGEDIIPGIQYCEGWNDHKGMGVSVLCAYDYASGRYRVFCEDNLSEFADLVKGKLVVGFNHIRFDNSVCLLGEGIEVGVEAQYDVLQAVWKASGLGPVFSPSTHGGFKLDDCARVNLGKQKTYNGALAPIAWQRGRIGTVIDYCLEDVRLTKLLFDMALNGELFKCPKTGKMLELAKPTL